MFLCRMSFVALLMFFLRPVSCFSGRPPLVYDVPLCFAASCKARALFFSAGSLLGTFQAGFSVFFRVLDQFVGLREAYFTLFLHRGSARAHLCQLAPPDHQLGGKWGHQVDFSPSPGVAVRATFCYFSVFFGITRFCEN